MHIHKKETCYFSISLLLALKDRNFSRILEHSKLTMLAKYTAINLDPGESELLNPSFTTW